MKALLLGRRSLLAGALAQEFEQNGTDFSWLSYDQTLEKLAIEPAFFEKFTHLFNCIAYTQVDAAEGEKAIAEQVNSHFPAALAKMAASSHCKLIHYSTDYVFDGNTSIMYTEATPSCPINVYGKTKREGEERVLDGAKDAIVIRTSWVYGSHKTNFVHAMLGAMMNRREVKVAQDQVGKTTFAADLARASIAMVETSGLFHFANEGEVSRYDWVRAIAEEARQVGFELAVETIHPCEAADFNPLAQRPHYSALSTEKYASLAGVKPRHYRDALSEYLRNLKSAGL